MSKSKPLGSVDESGAAFAMEMLRGDPTFGINFDRVQWDSEYNGYVIIELLLTDERQVVTPFSSHPNRYFHKNSRKFISLWEIAQNLGAKLYLVNYAKKGTTHEDEVLLMEVKNVDKEKQPHVETINTRFKRGEFSDWFRSLNNRGSR